MPIPPFSIDGVLPPFVGSSGPGGSSRDMTPYVVTAVEVVSTLATSTMRGSILSHWLNHRAALLVGREAHEGGEMAPSGIAHQADAFRVDPRSAALARTN